jgi:Uncharacterised nucleotidyltransferase
MSALAPVGEEGRDRDSDARTIAAMLVGRASSLDPRSFSEDDWDRLVRRAIDERVGPLLFWKLRHDPAIPERHKHQLRGELYRTEALSLTLYRELARLVEGSASRGLSPPVLLKGGAIAATLYEQIGLRPMSDLDVLVPRHELEAWLRRAREAGFTRLSPEMARGLTQRIHYQVALAGGDHGDVMIELHFGLVAGPSDWRSPDAPWFLERSEPLHLPPELSCPAMRQLLPGPHLLYLAAHAMLQHGGAQARLVWLHDVHLLVSTLPARIEWESVVQRARELRWDSALFAALTRSHELFGTSIPETAMVALEPPSGGAGSNRVRRLSDPAMSRAELVWSELASVSVGDRLRWAFAILFPRPDYMKWRYPLAGVLWPALYPYRWGRVLWEGSRALLHAARSGGRMPSC